MRSWTDRRRRPRATERSRFGRRSTAGGRDAVRFRRNRELLVREWTTLVLWAGLALMLADLAFTLHRFAERHYSTLAQFALPALAVAAAAGCLWRIRGSWVEISDLRSEQHAISARWRAERDDTA